MVKPAERHLAGNTQKSYRDSLKLLLPFISAEDPPRALLESS
jgi:hypothetical protein